MIDSFQNEVVTSFPTILEVAFKPIEKSYLRVVLFNTILVFIGVSTVAFFIDYKALFELGSHSFWIYIINIFIFSAIFFIKIIGFKKRKYGVREKDISYKKGLFFKKMTTVPFNRIQHIEIDQGPVSRFFNLVSLSVFTAGDSSDDLKISGLLKEEAAQIKEYISNKIDG